jgi:ankyrin repeat protein
MRQFLIDALEAGDVGEVRTLFASGADLHFCDQSGFTPMLHAVHGRDVVRDSRLLELLQVLVDHGAELNSVSIYGESALRVLSRTGRFDAVKLLLDAGADEAQLGWTPLIKAVALGSLADVQALIDAGAPLEEPDYWSRTAWLVAIQTGQHDKMELLRSRGANVDARGRCGKPPLFYAAESHLPETLRLLIAQGQDLEAADEFGHTALGTAVEYDDLECVEILLKAGAQVDKYQHTGTPLSAALSAPIARCLLAAGADPEQLSYETHRVLVGLPRDPDEKLLQVSAEDFARGRNRRFGKSNPEVVTEPFWEAMIRSGVNGYAATKACGGPDSFDAGPVWCAQRFGQSITFLPDGRIVQIAGEHEDYYDPDFCIYNDVFVHEPDGTIRILAYPEADFPPTDFHTATLVGDYIYIIGNVGYHERRKPRVTPLYRLDIRTFRIEALNATGEAPGWISRHRADLLAPQQIWLSGGKCMVAGSGKDEFEYSPNEDVYLLDIEGLVWLKS